MIPEQKMTPEEEMQYAKDRREHVFSTKGESENRLNDASDEFAKLEVQIAAILFALVAFFVQRLSSSASFELKITFSVGVCFLLISLILGLFYLKREGLFWRKWLAIRNKLYINWDKVLKKEITFKEAQAYSAGITGKNEEDLDSSPNWPWVLQSITLGLALAIILFIFFVCLFGSASVFGNNL